MMLLNRHRIAKLIELAELERRLAGPERMLREEDVALLVKAAYDDASDAARAAFMARVQPMPVAAWPWSAVQVKAVRGGGGVVAAGGGGRAIVGFSPTPAAVTPPALLLIRGEAESADAEPGNRLPDRGTPEAAPWEPLHRALDRWDTQAIARWIGPQGWISPDGVAAGEPAQHTEDGAASGQPAGAMGGSLPAPQPPAASTFSWRSPAVIAVGTTVASTVGVVLFSLQRRRVPASVAPQQETL
ncbi:MAG: hypothetical protein IPJ56_17970 [Gemmatimonadetes bacterium]|nr:hypothetical protein [Gemmatimonadota bacterium]